MQDSDTVKRALLDPVDRLSEIMFGLLMALTFTGTMSVTLGEGGTVRGILLAALGCNLAWGIVDGVMYLLRTLTARRRNQGFVSDIRHANAADRPGFVRELIGDDMARNLTEAELGDIAGWLARNQARTKARSLHRDDFRAAAAIFFLVVISTFPPVLPFLVLDDVFLAVRSSNLVAVGMLFMIGWQLDRHIEHGSRLMRVLVPLVGTVLVVATIALGG